MEVPRLYAIADHGVLGETLPAAVATMARAGVRWIQLRAKKTPGGALFALARDCRRRLAGTGAALWIDDRVDVAAMVPAAGVHVGDRDLPPAAARRVTGETLWIGRSTHDPEAAEAAAADPAVDVVALGPIFPTRGKEDPDPVVGLDALRAARQRVKKPLVAIGGIDASNLASVLAAGADAVAVLGAVCRGDVERNCARLLAAAEEAR